MTRVLAIDPGAGGAGYALWRDGQLTPDAISSDLPCSWVVDAIVVESGFIGKMGRQAMWGLGFDAGWRLCEAAARYPNAKLYTIRPDGVDGWRAALPERPDLPAAARFGRYDGLPGEVIVARLRLRYGYAACAHCSEHEVEACGIAEAAAAILARPKAKDRKALKPVKRGAL